MTNHSKVSLRSDMRAAARRIPAAERARASQQLGARLLQLPLWEAAQSVLLYLPFPSEPDIRPLFGAAWETGKATLLLRFQPASQELEPCQIHNLHDDLNAEGPFGLAEPASHCPLWPANQLDLLLVPGVAFSMSGRRLGRGRGYYDRFLRRATGVALGLAFDWQVATDIPTEPHDMGVHCILTPTRWQEVTDRRPS